MALLTEIHYLFIQSPLDIEAALESYRHSEVISVRFAELFVDALWFTWPETKGLEAEERGFDFVCCWQRWKANVSLFA